MTVPPGDRSLHQLFIDPGSEDRQLSVTADTRHCRHSPAFASNCQYLPTAEDVRDPAAAVDGGGVRGAELGPLVDDAAAGDGRGVRAAGGGPAALPARPHGRGHQHQLDHSVQSLLCR